MDDITDLFYEYLRDMILHAIRLGVHSRDDFWYAFLNDVFEQKNLEYHEFTKLLDACSAKDLFTKKDYLLLFGLYAWFKGKNQASALALEHALFDGKTESSLTSIETIDESADVKNYLKNLFAALPEHS